MRAVSTDTKSSVESQVADYRKMRPRRNGGQRRSVRDLDRLQRERYLILRSLRLAHAYLDRLDAGAARADQCLPQLVDFLHHFACEHFFSQEEQVLEALVQRRAAEAAHRERLRQLRRDHELGRAIVASVQAALGQGPAEPRRVRVDLGKLICQLSNSLVRGQDAVATIRVRFGPTPEAEAEAEAVEDHPSARRATGTGDGRVPDPSGPREDSDRLEAKYRQLLEELEQVYFGGGG